MGYKTVSVMDLVEIVPGLTLYKSAKMFVLKQGFEIGRN